MAMRNPRIAYVRDFILGLFNPETEARLSPRISS
jgi:hypothetical protein